MGFKSNPKEVTTMVNNVEEGTKKSKSEGVPAQNAVLPISHKRTRGFIRAQQKRARLLELVPADALIVAIDLARDEHCIWMMTVKKEPLDRLKIPNSPAG